MEAILEDMIVVIIAVGRMIVEIYYLRLQLMNIQRMILFEDIDMISAVNAIKKC